MLGNGYPSPSSSAARRRRGRPRGSGGGYGYWQSNSYQQQQQQERVPAAPPCTEFDMAYFRAYSHIGVHEEMIKDRVRTETYKSAIMRFQHLIAGKVVLDVGCGTGILAIFCAFAGAKRVYAVDASEIAAQASEVVKENNLSDRVTVLLGRVEDVNIDEKVDVIISEWMGYMLLYESMLPSIIFSRDKWLKPGGIILPSHASRVSSIVLRGVNSGKSVWECFFAFTRKFIALSSNKTKSWYKQLGFELVDTDLKSMEPYGTTGSIGKLFLAPVTHADRYRESIDFWHDVYGIKMSAMVPLAKQCAFEEPCIETISGENVLTWPILVKEVDCYTVTARELESVTAKFSFSSMLQAPLHGFAFWFDVVFTGPTMSPSTDHIQPPFENTDDTQTQGTKKRIKTDESIVLSTAPEDAPTHWQQTLLYLYDPIELKQDQKIDGSVTLSQSKENQRFLNIHLEFSSGGRSFVKESMMR